MVLLGCWAALRFGELVELTVFRSRQSYPKVLRRIQARVEVDGKEVEMVFLTNNREWSAGTIADLYRCRWQVELAFKRLKSLLHIDRLEAKDPDLVRTWILAHIIAALLIEDPAAEALDFPPSALGCAA